MDLTKKTIIKKLFNELNVKCNYAILHHIENIFNDSDDIDFIVDISRREMHSFLKWFSLENNLFLGKSFRISSGIYRYDLFFYLNNELKKIELDCACRSKGYDELMIDSFKLLQNRVVVVVNDCQLYKVSNLDEIKYYIKKKAYKSKPIVGYEEYFKKLDSSVTLEEITLRHKQLEDYYNSGFYKLKKVLLKGMLLFSRLCESPSYSICFLGPDGSGKSTIINEIIKSNIFINNYYFHLKPIPQKENKNVSVVSDPHNYKPYSLIKSWIKLVVFLYQYNLGWLRNIIPLKVKPSLIIFDRYYDDLLVDNKRYRYGGGRAVAKFVKLFIPRPEIYFVLSASAKIIYNRKQEVQFKELERQIIEYKSLTDGKRYILIDVDKEPQDVVFEVIKNLIIKMNEGH